MTSNTLAPLVPHVQCWGERDVDTLNGDGRFFSHEQEAPRRRPQDNIESGGAGDTCCIVFQMGVFIARTGPIFELLLVQATGVRRQISCRC